MWQQETAFNTRSLRRPEFLSEAQLGRPRPPWPHRGSLIQRGRRQCETGARNKGYPKLTQRVKGSWKTTFLFGDAPPLP